MNQNYKGTTMLKVVGILMIIFSAISLIGILIGGGLTAGLADILSWTGLDMSGYYVAIVVGLVGTILELVAGILGIAYCRRPEKAGIVIAFGVILVILCVVSNVVSVQIGVTFSIISVIIGLILPVLYLIGGLQNKKSI